MSEIDVFLADLDEQRRSVLERVLTIAERAAPEAERGTSYGMPALRYAGKPLLGFTVSKEHMSLHPFSPAVVTGVADDLKGFSLSKGTIRFTPEQPVPDAVVREMVRLRIAEIEGK